MNDGKRFSDKEEINNYKDQKLRLKQLSKKIKIKKEMFFELTFDWLIYYSLFYLAYIFLYLDPSSEFFIKLNQPSLPHYLFITSISSFILTCFFYLLIKPIKRILLGEETLIKNLIWHIGSLGLGSFFWYMLGREGLEYFQNYYSFNISLISAYFYFSGFLLLLKIVYIYFISDIDLKEDFQKLKKQASRIKVSVKNFDIKNTRIAFYLGYLARSVYSLVFTLAQIIICGITFLMTISFFLLFMVLIFNGVLSVITLHTSENLITAIALIFALFIILGIPFFFVSILVYYATKLLSITLINLSMGIKRNYVPVNTRPAKNFKLDVLNEKITSLKYWNPVIELSFFIIAFYILLYNELHFPSLIAIFGTFIIGINTIVNIWIFEDLNVSLVQEEKATTMFGFVKEIRFSKNSIQLASIFPIIKFFTKTFTTKTIIIPIIEIEMPIFSFFTKIFGGGIILIFLLGFVGLFSWSYLLILKQKYPMLVKDLEKKIPRKTKRLAGNNYL